MSTVPTHPDPLVAAALDRLRCFHVANRYEAARTLQIWVRYPELSNDQRLGCPGSLPVPQSFGPANPARG
jgi:hypothetical protein